MTPIARVVGGGCGDSALASTGLRRARVRPRYIARWDCCRGVVLFGSVGSISPLGVTVSILNGAEARGMCTPWVTAPHRGLTHPGPRSHREPVWAALKAHCIRQKEERMRVGSAWLDRGLVFSPKSGPPSTPARKDLCVADSAGARSVTPGSAHLVLSSVHRLATRGSHWWDLQGFPHRCWDHPREQ